METEIKKMIKSCDLDELYKIQKNFDHYATYCKITKQGEDIFLQLVYDGDISEDEYFIGENEIIKMCNNLYEENKEGTIEGFFTVNSKNLMKNAYAKKTISLAGRIKLNRKRNKCININSKEMIEAMTQIGCRDIGVTVLYFHLKKICVCIDALKCIFFNENKELILQYLDGIQCEHELY